MNYSVEQLIALGELKTKPVTVILHEFEDWLRGCREQSIRPALVKDAYLYIRQAVYTALITEGRRSL